MTVSAVGITAQEKKIIVKSVQPVTVELMMTYESAAQLLEVILTGNKTNNWM